MSVKRSTNSTRILKTSLARGADSVLKHFGLRVVKDANLYDWQRPFLESEAYQFNTDLPPDAIDYLKRDNPRLKELERQYAMFDPDVTTPLLWTKDHISDADLMLFRGDNAYVWQTRSMKMNILSYALTTYYLKTIDELQLLDNLVEDTYFGVHYFHANGKVVSRDLLDSISEINFLNRHLGIAHRSNFSVLDIGAGYGRLGHRMTSALPSISHYFCTDAVPISTFISEFYLRFRKTEPKTSVIPVFDIEQVLRNQQIDLAINIHSFSECKLTAIEWWLSKIAKAGIQYLMIVPNAPVLTTSEGINFSPIIDKYGYKLIANDPKYPDPVLQGYGINPSYYYLFSLS